MDLPDRESVRSPVELLARSSRSGRKSSLAAQWAAFAREIGVSERVAGAIVVELTDACLARLDGWTAEFRERHGDQPVLETVPRVIGRQARRVRRAMQPK